jgi:hypothetical protein
LLGQFGQSKAAVCPSFVEYVPVGHDIQFDIFNEFVVVE